MSSSSGRLTSVAAGDLQVVAVAERPPPALPPRPLTLSSPSPSSSALVEYTPPAVNPEDEDLEVKLRRIIDCVPVRVSNTSGSSAGSGSGDFHQATNMHEAGNHFTKYMSDGPKSRILIYRQMRRKEQDRVSRMEVDYQKRKEAAEFNQRREERLKAAEERSAKKRLKRQKKKQKKKEKKCKRDGGSEASQKAESSDEDGDSDKEET